MHEDDTQISFKKPSQPILELADFVKSPDIAINPSKDVMIILYRDTYKNIEDLNQKEARLAGIRINPEKRISSSITYVNQLTIKKIKGEHEIKVNGLPDNAKLSHLIWSPDEKKIAFIHTDVYNEIWILDIDSAYAHKISDIKLNASLGNPITWFPCSKKLLINIIPTNIPSYIKPDEAIPKGPSVSENHGGVVSNNRTYQDLLQNPLDEENFENLLSSELHIMDLKGNIQFFKEKNIFKEKSFSPDGKFISVTSIHKPYSYAVPLNRFPFKIEIYNLNGELIKVVNEVALSEHLPKGFMSVRKGKRNMFWRNDKPHTLYFTEALDGGDQSVKAEYRDALYSWEAPFVDLPVLETKTKQRFGGIIWGDTRHAIIFDQWYDTRNIKTYLFDPSTKASKIISDRNFQDIYSDPGDFQTKKNKYGKQVLFLQGTNTYLIGDGYHKGGQNAFVDYLDLSTLKKERIYTSNSQNQYLERIITIIENEKKLKLLVNIQSKVDYPNYFLREFEDEYSKSQITFYENPFKSLNVIEKKVIHYQREDGVELSSTLYLPPKKDTPTPLLIWAYPTEYKDRNSAQQSTANANEFNFPHYGSFLYYVMKGYAVLDDAPFPIIGENNEEPNNSFLVQLKMNAEAAIKAVKDHTNILNNKIAIGGHSYGAFMTANLLTHTDLFACGIARSGAYNRTLTPFGFQTEQRNYWEIPSIYNEMSPFMSADKMKKPLLLIHGAEDNNPGTFTLQTERYYQALKGLGVPVRMTILPKEGHSYEAKENIFHLLWEQEQFLEKYLK